jgi:hypothetical protein
LIIDSFIASIKALNETSSRWLYFYWTGFVRTNEQCPFPHKKEVSFTTAENLTRVGIVPELVTFIFIAKPAIFSFDHPDFCDNISAKTAFGSLRKASREEPTQEAHG